MNLASFHKRARNNSEERFHSNGHLGDRLGYKRPRIAPPRDFDEEDPKQDEHSDAADREGRASQREYRPSMLSFKAFLLTQDDSITDDEALEKFSEYKKEFNRQQLNEFFVAHKDEEWMKEKYHPDYINTDAQKDSVNNRLKVFMDLYREGCMDDLTLSMNEADKIELLLDNLVARLEGEESSLEADSPQRDALCRTTSVHLRTVHPDVTREELLSVLNKYPGFKRLCMSDPSPDTRWRRRGWATFSRDTKIKEICFNLSNLRMKDCDLNPVVNKDLSRRIRGVSSVSWDKSVVRCCLQLANQVITKLDAKWNLWASKPNEILGEESGNPLLSNIAEHLVEEMSAEEEELLGSDSHLQADSDLHSDPGLTRILDRLVLYLRLVHSVDLYNASQYITEEQMPNRCGIFHVRDLEPRESQTCDQEVANFKENLEKKVKNLMSNWNVIADAELQDLGGKGEDEAVQIFVQGITEELGNNKFLCSSCGKKFKTAEFVQKHIYNKHEDKIEGVKKEVQFFNNYIRDPRRPCLPEKPKTEVKATAPMKPKPKVSVENENLSHKPRGSIKDRLGYKKGNLAITCAVKDPRSVVDYSDVEFADIFS